MPKSLVIVESPTKARTIAGFLGPEVVVESSIGHIRDLPRSASEIPKRAKGEDWARLGVDVENDFEPLYIVPKEKRQQIKKLKELLADAEHLYLATDEDREGESIAWHLTEVLKPKVPVHRMVFHEITKPAIAAAFENPRDIDDRLVQAQEARRILDRLFGYEVSPVLWRKVQQGLSAGRVQSVAVRIVVERERERMAFTRAGYWSVEGTFAPDQDRQKTFSGSLVEVNGERVATGKDFDSSGTPRQGVRVLDQTQSTDLATHLSDTSFTVRSVDEKPYKRSPYPPFRTSTLQQEAGRKLRFSSSRTMSVAQRLYENGFITYMRTDSTALADAAVSSARDQISKLYGSEYLSPKPRAYASKVKGAQEAHEAIRPSGEIFQTPEQVATQVGKDEARLYDLIWKRTIASQMADAKGVSVSARLAAKAEDGTDVLFATSGRTITFPGFLRAYVQGADDPDAALDDSETVLPPLEEGQRIAVQRLEPTGHETRPPARYTEASLVQKLEDLGVGRPSTYSSIMSTIQDRGYVWKKGSALVPTFTAFGVVALLEGHFPNLVDYDFTAEMEDDLDRIAAGDEESVPWLTAFYFGDEGLREKVATRLDEIDPREVGSIPIGEDDDGTSIVARIGRYGPYVQRGEDERASIPEDLAPDELTAVKAVELIETQNAGDKIFGTDPESGLVVLGKTGRFGPYVQLGEQEEGSKEKPKRASLLKDMILDEMGLDDALRLLSLPRTVGVDENNVEILALNGRYGPYIQRGDDRRSLETEDQLFEITTEEALKLLAEPPRRRGQRRASSLKELGEDPVTGKKVTLRSGRYGPYVTDGEVNASLRQGDSPDTIDIDRAAELLTARRERLGK